MKNRRCGACKRQVGHDELCVNNPRFNEQKQPYKTRSAKKVLQLMDNDYDYVSAVKRVMIEDKISRTKLEKELNPFI